jgi:hypothetical protein
MAAQTNRNITLNFSKVSLDYVPQDDKADPEPRYR